MRKLATLAALGGVFLASAASAQTFPSTGGPFPIADSPPGGALCGEPGTPLTNNITAAGAGNALDVDIAVDITHTFTGDFDITVTHGATSVTIMDNPGTTLPTGCGCAGDNPNFIADDEGGAGSLEAGCGTTTAYTVGGRYTPNSPLTAFDGAPFAGTWTISITDGGGGDTGTLNSWAVIVTPNVASEPGSDRRGNDLALTGANPVADRASFSLTVAEAQTVNVVVFDALGRAVRTAYEGPMNAGATAFMDVNVSDLAPGTYIIRAEGSAMSLTRPFTVQ